MFKTILILSTLLFCSVSNGQEWTLRLSSNIELRKWTLTNRVDKSEKPLGGATIILYKGETKLNQTNSDEKGNFSIDIPAQGEFILTVAFAGCNSKKFSVSTAGVPDAVGKDNYKPTVIIGGFVLSEPITGVDYVGLNEALVRVEYKTGGQNFDKDETVTNKGLNIISKINVQENFIIDKFCGLNKSGDDALHKKKCQLAKDCYSKARSLMPNEKYPTEQLKRAEDCLDGKKAIQEAAAETTSTQAQAAKIANEKAIKEKQDKNNASFKKTGQGTTKEIKTKQPEDKTQDTQLTNTGNANQSKLTVKNNVTANTIAPLLDVDRYKICITKGDNFYKKQRYKEAKAQYAEALKIKSDDAALKAKLKDCEAKCAE